MDFSTIADEMMDLYKTNLASSFDDCLSIHRQMQDMINSMLPGMSGYTMEQAGDLSREWIKAIDNALVAWQAFQAEPFEGMTPDDIFKPTIEHLWRQFGLASLGETSMLRDQFENLKGQIADLQNQDRVRQIAEELENHGSLVAQEDLKPLKKAVSELSKAMESVGDIESLQLAVAQLENDLSRHVSEFAQIKQLVAKINPQISSLTTAIDRLSDRIGNAKPISME